jgi:hypothetical protein
MLIWCVRDYRTRHIVAAEEIEAEIVKIETNETSRCLRNELTSRIEMTSTTVKTVMIDLTETQQSEAMNDVMNSWWI